MTDILLALILVATLLSLLLYAICSSVSDYEKRRSSDSDINTIRKNLTQITSRLLSRDKQKDAELQSVVKRLENVAERLEKATEIIERNSDRISNSITILSMLKTIDKL